MLLSLLPIRGIDSYKLVVGLYDSRLQPEPFRFTISLEQSGTELVVKVKDPQPITSAYSFIATELLAGGESATVSKVLGLPDEQPAAVQALHDILILALMLQQHSWKVDIRFMQHIYVYARDAMDLTAPIDVLTGTDQVGLMCSVLASSSAPLCMAFV